MQNRSPEEIRNAFRNKEVDKISVVESDYDYGEFLNSIPRMSEEQAQEYLAPEVEGDEFNVGTRLVSLLI